MHQVKVMLAGLRIYFRACLDRNKKIDPEQSSPGILNEVHDLVKNDTVETLKIEMDELDKKINDFKTEIVETMKALRKDMKKTEEQIMTQLRNPGQDRNPSQDDPRDENGGRKDSPYQRKTSTTGDEIQENIKMVGFKKTDLDGGGDRPKGGGATKNGTLPPLRMTEAILGLKTE